MENKHGLIVEKYACERDFVLDKPTLTKARVTE